MKTSVPGLLAGLVATAALAAPALAAPANVTVRVEGDAATLVPRTAVTTTPAPVGKPGSPTCSGTSALGALDRATGGDWTGTYDPGFATYTLVAVKGETHDTATSSYWSFWINDTYSSTSVCGQELQEGDSVLLVPDCYAATCTPVSPLRLTGVPATAAPGATVAVKVQELHQPVFPATETTVVPATGATVHAGGATATAGADGVAQLTLAGSGPVAVQATKAGHTRSATEATCVTTGADGACGTTATGAPPAAAVPDTTAPVASISGLKRGTVFSRRKAPRELSGTVTADPSGLKSVRLSIARKRGKRCWVFDGGSERFERHRCRGSRSFRIGDRADWSYLLPRRLPRGRYAIRVVAIDKAGNDAATETVVRVR